MKAMHRLIVTSATYRQSSLARRDLAEKDPRNLLLARQERLRVEGEIVRDALAPQRFRASLIAALGALALVLSTLGIYGVVAYAVSRQTREIGVRMALGEEQSAVRRRVLLSALRMAGLGIGLGVVLALASSKWLSAFVVGVQPRDPMTLGAVALLLVSVTALAAYIPARRASRIDPLVALRAD